MLSSKFFLIPSIFIACFRWGETLAFDSGQYRIGNYASLEISSKNLQGIQKIEITSVGGSGSLCSLKGSIVQGKVILGGEGNNRETKCEISLSTLQNSEIKVSFKERDREACQSFCGHNASFDGDYSKLPVTCTDQQIANKQEAFLVQYKAKQFKQAAATLTSIFPKCNLWLGISTRLTIRNDLAVTYANLNQKNECISILKPYTDNKITKIADRQKDKELAWEIDEGWALFHDDILKSISSARTNLKLCGYKFTDS